MTIDRSAGDRSSSQAPTSDAVREHAALVDQVYAQTRPAMIAALMGSVLLGAALWSQGDRTAATAWLLVFWLIQIPRHYLLAVFGRRKIPTEEKPLWGYRFSVGAVASSLMWGLAGFIFFPSGNEFHQSIMAMILVGTAASIAVAQAPLTLCYVPSVVLVLFPISVRFFMEGGIQGATLGSLGLLFIAALLGTARVLNNYIRESIALRIRNTDLIRSLRETSEQLEERVIRRTADLTEKNVLLRKEMAERELAREALRESEAKYRDLFEKASELVYIHDLQGRYTSVNSAVTHMLGYTPEEFLRLSFHDVVDPEYLEVTEKNFRLKTEEGVGKTGPYQVRVRNKFNQPLWFEVTSRVMLENGKPVGVHGTARDVTDRKQIEEALRQSEEKYRMMFENSPLGVFHFDAEGVITACNDNFIRILGSTKDKLIGLNSARDIEDEQMMGAIREALEGRIGHYEDYYTSITSGKTTPVKCDFGPIFAGDGSVVGGIGIIEDITERRNAEEQLRKSEKKYRNILETITDGYHEVDLHGNITFFNDYTVELTGYSREEFTGINYRDLMDEANAEIVFRAYNEVYRTGKSNEGFQYRITGKDGIKRDVSVSVSPVRDEEGEIQGFRGIIRDVTEQTRLEERLRQAARMEAIGQLAGGVAHDFNNLLTAMLGYCTMLDGRLDEDSPDREKVRQIGRAAERAASLTQQLLAFGRKQMLSMRVILVNEVIRDVESMLRRLIGENIEIATVLEPDVWAVQADPGQVDQILINLAINARDAMPHGGRLTIETKNVCLDEAYQRTHPDVIAGDYVMIAVSDTGRGMDKTTLSRIFDPFFTTKEKGVGTGLGLATVYGIIKQHRGHIIAYSEPGSGSTFKVYIPRSYRGSEPTFKLNGEPRPVRGEETILVVEDEKMVRELASEALELMGYTVFTAATPSEAIEKCIQRECDIDLVLTDVVLPQMDGKTLYHRLSKIQPRMRVIFMSGYTENAIVHHGVLESSINFLQKPFTVTTLAEKVREVLENK